MESRVNRKIDDFRVQLTRDVDELVSQMRRPGAGKAVDDALFSGPDVLNASYAPGTTESNHSSEGAGVHMLKGDSKKSNGEIT